MRTLSHPRARHLILLATLLVGLFAGPVPGAHACLEFPPLLHWLAGAEAPGYAAEVVVEGNLAYLVDWIGGLQIIDITDPDRPSPVGALPTPGVALDLAVAGDLVYVADSVSLRIVDVQDPGSPSELGHLDLPGLISGVAVHGDHVYLAAGSLGVHVVDAADPAAPSLLATIDEPAGALRLVIDGDLAHVATGAYGLSILDLTDPAAPVELGVLRTDGGMARDVALAGHHVFLADADGGLRVIDVIDPAEPKLVGELPIAGGPHAVSVDGTIAYVSLESTAPSLAVVDVSRPTNPVLLARVNTGDRAQGVALTAEHALVADAQFGLSIFTRARASAALAGDASTTAPAAGIDVTGDLAFVAQRGIRDLEIFDLTDPVSPVRVGIYDGYGSSEDVLVRDGIAYLASDNMVVAIDVSDPAAPVALSDACVVSTCFGLDVDGTRVYAAAWASGLSVINATNPENLWRMGLVQGFMARDVAAAGSEAYVAASDEGLIVVNVGSPYSPQIIGELELPGEAYRIELDDDLVYVVTRGHGLEIVDVSDPAAPALVSSVGLTGDPRGIVLEEQVAYVTSERMIHVIDVADPQAPRIIGAVDLPDQGDQVAIGGDHLYVAGTLAGLLVAPLQCGTTTAVEPAPRAAVQLLEPRPNPFNPATTIAFELPVAGAVRIAVHDLQGRLIRVLVEGEFPAGRHTTAWDGRDVRGGRVASGVYLCRLESEQGPQVRKLALVQ